jgi:hypothetical protein
MIDSQLTCLDIIAPEEGVEILIRRDGEVLWVNVDGMCRLRISRLSPAKLVITDERKV